MKPAINAYLYPTPKELDYQLALRRAQAFDPRNHISPDDTDGPVEMTDIERTIRDVFAEVTGLPPESFFVKRRELSDAAQDLRDLPLSRSALRRYLDRYISDPDRYISDPDRYIPDNPHEFVWLSHSGERHFISKMASPHMFYALRMLFNHSVPPVFRILRPGEAMKRYPDVPHWSPAYRQAAIAAFTKELNERNDLDPSLQVQFDDMKANTEAILKLGL